ncbi:DNA-binding transcriptional ArsR family regulator [Yoonia maritima]|uniref:DNA-binding transcriptional ArsR family regulator n=1 Tax=Yoonia maritima TaxID=1435347 RepID=A0A2T0VYY3_9RHOB|nr:metalloregulator ArsR/SmtB family transcription factor [Yoonia maritima]PRY77555.1 DNA-binding transcriptional ArsR family regulator [Yoonia maritima]
MDNVTAAQGFSALGSESRIEVFQTLVKAGKNGLLVGDIQQRTGIPASTLAHHLKFLSTAQLILQEKKGRAIVNRANFDHLENLAAFILEECCSEPGPQS